MSEQKFLSSYKNKIINCVGHTPRQTLLYFPHYTNTSSVLYANDSDEDDDDEDAPPSTTLSTTLPKLLYVSENDKGNDDQQVVLKLVQSKAEYVVDVGKTSTLCLRDEKCKEKKSKDKDDPYTMHLKTLMELAVQDPDPYFYGSYNWYHTGGALEVATVNDIDFVFHVSGNSLNVFNSSRIIPKRDGLSIESLDKTTLTDNSPIFEIIKSENSRFVGARQRNRFSTFYLQDETAQQDLPSLKSVPFISGDFHRENLYTIDADRVLRRFNLELAQETGRMRLKRARNKSFWCQLRRHRSHLIFADQQKLRLYDCRLFGSRESNAMEIDVGNIVESCDDVTCVKPDLGEHNLYIGTSHHLLVVDIRAGTKHQNQLTRYAHLLRTPPLMIDAVGGGPSGMIANERIASLTGTFSDDSVLINHTKAKAVFATVRVASINDTVAYLKRKGLLAEAAKIKTPDNNVNIGSRLLRLKGKLYLFTHKSSADVFFQEIEAKDPDEETSTTNYYENESKLLQNLTDGDTSKGKYEVTTVTNFNSLKNILKYEMPSAEELPDIQEAERAQRWQRPVANLHSFKDLLSSDLLAVWEVNSLSGERQLESSTIVNGWLRNQDHANVEPDENFSD